MLYQHKETKQTVHAAKWDGSEDHLKKIASELGLVIENGYARRNGEKSRGVCVVKDFFIFDDGVIRCWEPEIFLNVYEKATESAEIKPAEIKPISMSRPRKRLIEISLPVIYRELKIKQAEKNDDWLKKCPYDLWRWLTEEVSEVGKEVDRISLSKEPDFDAMEIEAAHVAICAMFLIEKAQALRKEKKGV